jgi:MOSC domain-containing protein
MSTREVGRVVGLWRYPVKSMAAEALSDVVVDWAGLAGDRRWAFVRGSIPRSGFPWMTIREDTAMLEHVPRFVDPAAPDKSRTLVRTPGGEELDVVDPALAASLGDDVRVIKEDRGVFDAMPLSLITTTAIAELRELVGFDLVAQRFRPNLLVESDEREDAWLGAELSIGGMAMRVDQRDSRCVIVNVDPATLDRDPSVLRTLARERSSCIGVYGSTVRPGRVAVGDAVLLDS